MKRILCYGDSNTYGYDPRSFLGDRYPADVRWTGLLAADLGIPVHNSGQNGRTIPRTEWALEQAAQFPAGTDLAVIMLGSNDLLQTSGFTARDTAARMENFLWHLLVRSDVGAILLISPPPMRTGAWVTEERLLTESARLAREYEALARRLGIRFADAGQWDVELVFDGVHFSEAGHRAFARGLRSLLERADSL